MQHAPLIIDIAGTALTEDDGRRLAHPLVGGLILFARNWQDREQLGSLCAEVRRLRPELLICVDHEGGRVQRFRSGGFTHLPPMRALGELWMQDAMRAQDAASAYGYVLGAELRACGVDLSFTPVLDLDWGPSGVIGDRAFHADARVVTMLAKSLAHGLRRAGMACCGKHFPGHGFVAADSHTALPRDTRTLKAILAADAAPYGWLSSVLDAVMAAHVVYPRVDARPAGYSARWLQAVLRGRLGFGGAIFTDDLSMQAARHLEGRTVTPVEAVLAALDAGCDLALLCNQSLGGGAVLDEVIDGLARAQVQGRWQPREASAARCQALLPREPAPDWDALMRSPAYLHALALVP
ncbi:MAG: beta-N-acetylhexosaminidase [Rubrivivax sp.]|nr:beta-N-acetylhexosaminidase [Rubrivivax sp.]TXI22221.1 MAG: beta-N-acetylhexosaminidase [Ottowia sp.]HOZ92538.1 beta-N-acetylhexosaminidase [Ottowia sp.]HQO51977.1 beta-N-acetylhexosaminidase [Ottowia sp.]HQQ53452.1 beta-N-acetylhexosaminidase [Ottowia sp.]